MVLSSIYNPNNILLQTWCVPLLTTTDKVNSRRFHLRIELTDDTCNRQDSLPDRDKKKQEKRAILCHTCFAMITSSEEAVSRNDRHTHVFLNPAGIVFATRCFAHAPGCKIHGQAVSEFSWFSGYQWQYVFCATCLTHLGWWFLNENDDFFSLIASRLTD